MTGRLRLSPRARADVEDIWKYSARKWGIDQAEIHVRRLGHHIALIVEHPDLGRSRSDIRAGYHSFPCEDHVAFYRIVNGGAEVVRNLHKRMDYRRHL